MVPIVAIIGKPNVGKSSLFNRIVGFRKAIVSPVPGTTRDRHYSFVSGDKPFFLVDTGGIEPETEGVIKENIVKQAAIAIHQADLVLLLVESGQDLTRDDFHVVDMIRKSGKKVFVVVTKCDSGTEVEFDQELISLGFGDPIGVSAFHNLGMDNLQIKISGSIPQGKEVSHNEKNAIRLSILGKPNTGKSSLINRMIGEEKMIVSEIPGTTIDSVDIDLMKDDTLFTLVDTAGIKKRGKIQPGVEKYSLLRSLQACKTSDVCLLLIDGEKGVTAQDLHIANFMLEQKTGVIIGVNKMDSWEFDDEKMGSLLQTLRYRFSFLPWAPVVFLSAKTGRNIDKVFELAKEIHETRSRMIPKEILKRWLQEALAAHQLSSSSKSRIKLYRVEQTDARPPTFLFTDRSKETLHFSFVRYLENKLRENFGFIGTSIVLKFSFRGAVAKILIEKTETDDATRPVFFGDEEVQDF